MERRAYLRGVSVAGVASLAGCGDILSGGDSGSDGAAWPMLYGGPDNARRTGSAGPTAKPTREWSVTVPDVAYVPFQLGSVLVGDETVVAVTERSSNPVHAIRAIDIESGNELWDTRSGHGSHTVVNSFGAVLPWPVVYRNALLVPAATGSADVVAHDLRSGRELWTLNGGSSPLYLISDGATCFALEFEEDGGGYRSLAQVHPGGTVGDRREFSGPRYPPSPAMQGGQLASIEASAGGTVELVCEEVPGGDARWRTTLTTNVDEAPLSWQLLTTAESVVASYIRPEAGWVLDAYRLEDGTRRWSRGFNAAVSWGFPSLSAAGHAALYTMSLQGYPRTEIRDPSTGRVSRDVTDTTGEHVVSLDEENIYLVDPGENEDVLVARSPEDFGEWWRLRSETIMAAVPAADGVIVGTQPPDPPDRFDFTVTYLR